MKRAVQRMAVCALCVAMLFTGVPFMAMENEGGQGGLFGVQEVSAATNSVNPGHSEGGIQNYLKNNNISALRNHTFATQPEKPDTPGNLSSNSKQDALNTLNAIRYVAGLDPVTLDDSLGSMQQQAAFVLWNIGTLSHHPKDNFSKPAGMSDNVWIKGDEGAGQANLAMGYANLNQAVVCWLSDADAGNLPMIGHRRWVLNPTMGKTGFGAAGSYYSMHSFDGSNSSAATTTNVIWPAENTPVQFFNIDGWRGQYDPWSLSTGAKETKANIDVTLTCTAGSKKGTMWTFDGATTYTATDDGKYMNVDNGGYGQYGCIIFRPDGVTEYLPGDTYNVTITGTTKGTISYTVRFINGYPVTSLSLPESAILEPKESRTLVAEISPAEAQLYAKREWQSSDEDVATVDDKGKVTAVGNGTATITCTSEGKSDTCTVTVLTRIPMSDPNIEITVGQVPYSGKAEKPPFVIKNRATGEVYVEGVDYQASYADFPATQWGDAPMRIEPGRAMVYFHATYSEGKLSGTPQYPYAYYVTKKSITEDMITVTYNNNAPTVTVKNGDLTLEEGKDYTLTLADGEEAGTAAVTVTATASSEHYEGTAIKTVPSPFANNTYTIKFDSNEGKGTMSDLAMVYGTAKSLPANTFTKDGHAFMGWNTKADGSGTAYTDQQSVNNLTTINNGTVTLYAQWSVGSYSIAFDSNNGSGTMTNLAMVYDEGKALPANAFTKEGYTFKEWNTKADGSGTAYTNEQVVKNLATSGTVLLYAQWTPNTYTIKFHPATGMGYMDDQPMTYDKAAELIECTFVKNDCIFDSWNTKEDGSGTTYTNKQAVQNLTASNKGTVYLYAQWAPVQAQKEITIDEIPAQAYTGKAVEPTLTVKADGTPLTIDQDYDVAYTDNINPGTAKATVTFKGAYAGTETKTVEFTIQSPFKAKGLWVSKHENTYVTFNWTGTPSNNMATAWNVQYRTKQIGTQYAWSKWTSSRESGKTLSKRVYLKPNYTIEFKVKHETDTAYLRSVFTTPAGGKYQSITQCRVKVVATASGAAYRQDFKTIALKTGVNFSGDTGNIIYIKKGTSIKVTPNHVYPRSNYSKYPRLYPNHAWYDVTDSTVASLTGTASTAGMKDGAVTIKGLKAGTTTIKITSCNGRGATLTIVVK